MPKFRFNTNRVKESLSDEVDENESIEIYTNETNKAHLIIGDKYIDSFGFIDEAYHFIDRFKKYGEKIMNDISMERIRNR